MGCEERVEGSATASLSLCPMLHGHFRSHAEVVADTMGFNVSDLPACGFKTCTGCREAAMMRMEARAPNAFIYYGRPKPFKTRLSATKELPNRKNAGLHAAIC